MAVRQLAPLILSDGERAELTSLTTRRRMAPALALRARIVLADAERRSEQRSGGQAGPGPVDGRRMASVFCGAARGRTA